MPASTIKQWAEGYEPSVVTRVVKRIERFSGNTNDTDTAAAAAELVELIKAALPKEATT